MGGGCAAINCRNNSRKGHRVHRFPTDQVRSRFWAQQCGRIDDWDPSKVFFLCEAHFDQNQYELYRADGRKLLKWNAIPTIFNFNQSASEFTNQKSLSKDRNKVRSKKKDLSEVKNASNPENDSNEFLDSDISYELSRISAENLSCELREDTKEKKTKRKRKIAEKNTQCESNEILDDVTYSLHIISPENYSRELEHLRENISCDLQQSAEDGVSFEIENVPYVEDDCGVEDACELEECRGGCTHKTIIDNYKMRISELEEQLTSMKNELNAAKTKLKPKTRKKTS